MRVKIFKVAVLAVFAFITGLNVYKAQTEVQLSDAQMKNVEALATNEESDLELICNKKIGGECYELVVSSDPYGSYYKVYLNWENKYEILP